MATPEFLEADPPEVVPTARPRVPARFGRQPRHGWKWIVAVVALGVFASGWLTGTLQAYHWVLLLVIPAVVRLENRGRQFFLDWYPLFLFWIVYDRLRLVQPYLLTRVAVTTPYRLEKILFGWLGGGEVPAHAWRNWLGSCLDTWTGTVISWAAQLIYLSHVFVLPLLLAYFWIRPAASLLYREGFRRHLAAFTVLHVLGMLTYVLLPAAPPWWVTLHGTVRPTTELLSQLDMGAAMDGALTRNLIATASLWFAAIPSLHGAYPVLLILLGWRSAAPRFRVALILYAAAMWAATVVLNQHYLIDLLAGVLVSAAALYVGNRFLALRVRNSGAATVHPLRPAATSRCA